MSRTIVGIPVAALIFACMAGSAQATPVAPLSPGITAGLSLLADASWRRCSRDRWGRMHCRRCWRDRRGRVHCRRW